ncbi:MAG: hypothetical protein AAF399_17930 [Bacteroidota bacterium]
MRKFLFSFLLLLGGSWTLLGQVPPHQRYLPHPLDSLARYSLDSLHVYFNDCNNGGQPNEKGLLTAKYEWNAAGHIQSATSYLLRQQQIRGKDSMAWIYRGDTVLRHTYEMNPADPDYREYAEDLDFGRLEDLYLPPFGNRRLVRTDTFIRKGGRLVEQRGDYSRSLYQYDAAGKLTEMQTIHPERVAMGMGGYTWETYVYDGNGNLSYKFYLTSGPDNRRDTSVHVFQYDSDGNLLSEIVPMPSVPGVSSMKQYQYEDGRLVLESSRRSTFRSSGPPDYTRTQISILFETTYRYEGEHLVEEKATRDGELETEGWLRYEYQERGLLHRKIRMNPFTDAPGYLYTYEYFFRE